MGLNHTPRTIPEPNRPSTWHGIPARLLTPSTTAGVPPPTSTLPQLLPLSEIVPEDFERLCLRLLEQDAEPVAASELHEYERTTEQVTALYGVPGQTQSGIDVYARDRLGLGKPLPERCYVSLQARRTKTVTPGQLDNSVDSFLAGGWSNVSRKFIYATAASARSNNVQDRIAELAGRLAEQFIEFTVWDQEEISKRLKSMPNVVDDFFGRAWVERFCGVEKAARLGTRLDARDVARLRKELAEIYTAVFSVADSGQVAFSFGNATRVSLQERFVTPDLVPGAPQDNPFLVYSYLSDDGSEEVHGQQPDLGEITEWDAFLLSEGVSLLRSLPQKRHRTQATQIAQRQPADHWLGTDALQVIVGGPGTGKSTLLRYLILDLLNEQPQWRDVATRWGQRLPIWLPFHFFTQRVAGNTGVDASIVEALKAWLEQYHVGHAWPLVKSALEDQRLLLIVDGLDEWVTDEAGQYAAAALETFAAFRKIPMVVSARPYGLAKLSLGAGWTYARVAQLSPDQQRLLASRYFYAAASGEDQMASPDVVEQSIDDFLGQVWNAPDLRSIGGTPLFLVLLMGLHLSSIRRLPTERFNVYDQAVQLLVADHPAKRRVAAAITMRQHKLTDVQTRVVLAHVAFIHQERGDVSAIDQKTLREDFVAALTNPLYLAMGNADAAKAADELMDVAEGEIGLLVRQGPSELGFLHRMLQEQLTAEYISDQLTFDQIKELFVQHIRDPRWREVLLGSIWRISRPSELSGLIDVIWGCVDESPAGLHVREMLAEICFGGYGIPAVDINRFAPDIINNIETHWYEPHRARLLDSALNGVEGVSTATILEQCLHRWSVAVQYPPPSLILHIAEIPADPGLSATVCELLMAAVRTPNWRSAFAAVAGIGNRFSRSSLGSDYEREILYGGLLRVLSHPPAEMNQAAALAALALAWDDDPVVVEILKEARFHSDDSVRMIALAFAQGVLHTLLDGTTLQGPSPAVPLSSDERAWLSDLIRRDWVADLPPDLVRATISKVARGHPDVVPGLVDALKADTTGYVGHSWVFSVALDVLADDERLIDFLCDFIRESEELSHIFDITTIYDARLGEAYPPSSPSNARVSRAIENRLNKSADGVDDRHLAMLAAVDRGPVMKETLLRRLFASRHPYWSAHALHEHFGHDEQILNALRSVLLGEPVRASTIANVATAVLGTNEGVQRLLHILQEIGESGDPTRANFGLVASEIARTYKEQDTNVELEIEVAATRTLNLLPGGTPHSDHVRRQIAAAFYPSAASRVVLDELEGMEESPVEPYVSVYRHHPEQVRPYLTNAATILRTLPEHLRARVCQSLADGNVSTEVVLRLTRRWADEISKINMSVTSLAYHRALVRAKMEGNIEDAHWERAIADLNEQAMRDDFRADARRRAAAVGASVTGNWTLFQDMPSPEQNASLVSVSLLDILDGPDWVLLQQIALVWNDLRSEFGESLIERFSLWSGNRDAGSIWDLLSLVAEHGSALQHDLASAVADDPDLLARDGILAWFLTSGSAGGGGAVDALISYLQNGGGIGYRVGMVVEEPERIGLQREDLKIRLEETLSGGLTKANWSALEYLTILFPDHPIVRETWGNFAAPAERHETIDDRNIVRQVHLALAYAMVGEEDLLVQLERDFVFLEFVESALWDRIFTRHVIRRLRRDNGATKVVWEAAIGPGASGRRSAQFLSLLANANGPDDALVREAEQQIASQSTSRLAQLARDPTLGATLSVRTILTRVADSALSLGTV